MPAARNLFPLRSQLVRKVFSRIRALITIAEVSLRPLYAKSSASTGSVPFSCLTGRPKPSRLTCTASRKD
eukprot:4851965-Prymnesium_polylepis.2